jgi:hypothetical protein
LDPLRAQATTQPARGTSDDATVVRPRSSAIGPSWDAPTPTYPTKRGRLTSRLMAVAAPVMASLLGAATVLGLYTPMQASVAPPSGGTIETVRAPHLSLATAPAGASGRTASIAAAADDLARVNALKPAIMAVAHSKNIDPALLAGMMSRETRVGLLLDRRGIGDNGHGYGVLQINNRSFGKQLKRVNWRDPRVNMELAADILDSFARDLEERAAALRLTPTSDELFRWTISAYNTGPERALSGFMRHHDSDAYTTGHDYGADVLARADYFRANGFVV